MLPLPVECVVDHHLANGLRVSSFRQNRHGEPAWAGDGFDAAAIDGTVARELEIIRQNEYFRARHFMEEMNIREIARVIGSDNFHDSSIHIFPLRCKPEHLWRISFIRQFPL